MIDDDFTNDILVLPSAPCSLHHPHIYNTQQYLKTFMKTHSVVTSPTYLHYFFLRIFSKSVCSLMWAYAPSNDELQKIWWKLWCTESLAYWYCVLPLCDVQYGSAIGTDIRQVISSTKVRPLHHVLYRHRISTCTSTMIPSCTNTMILGLAIPTQVTTICLRARHSISSQIVTLKNLLRNSLCLVLLKEHTMLKINIDFTLHMHQVYATGRKRATIIFEMCLCLDELWW